VKPKANLEPGNTMVRLDELTLDPANVRLHPERNKSVLEASLRRFGAARSIVVDGNGIVRAGNGTLEAARAAGIENALVIDADGGQLIVVRRNDWTSSEATAYSILDNRSSDLSKNDDPALVLMLQALDAEGISLLTVGYTDEEMAALAGALAETAEESDEDGGDDPLPEKYEIIVECDGEAHQREVFEKLESEGFRCRVITF
jgi:ParB-like chromosome segregation protein Spo0J